MTLGDWSRDGRFVIYQTNAPATRSDVWALPLIGERKPFLVLAAPSDDAVVSALEFGRVRVQIHGFVRARRRHTEPRHLQLRRHFGDAGHRGDGACLTRW